MKDLSPTDWFEAAVLTGAQKFPLFSPGMASKLFDRLSCKYTPMPT